MRSAFDFSPFRRSTVGFDRLFDLLENSAAGQAGENYPPFDLVQLDDNSYRISLAVAGFKRDEIDITAQQNLLIVAGRRPRTTTGRAISTAASRRARSSAASGLPTMSQVRGADMKDGLLSIDLVREIPEAMRPRKISLGGGEAQDHRADAKPATEGRRAGQGAVHD